MSSTTKRWRLLDALLIVLPAGDRRWLDVLDAARVAGRLGGGAPGRRGHRHPVSAMRNIASSSR